MTVKEYVESERAKKPGHVPEFEIEYVSLAKLRPAEVNGVIYKPVRPDDPAVVRLSGSIDERGVLDPLVVTLDDVIISGHRRATAAKLSGLITVPVRREPIYSHDPGFEKLLVTFNMQRDKDPAERVREELVLADPEEAYRAVLSHRAERSKVKVSAIKLNTVTRRSGISAGKQPFLDAIKRVIDELEDHWPLSDRRVHYALLNDPPLIHSKKPGSRYANDLKSYKATCEVLTRARIAGLIPFEAIGDETRPVNAWAVRPNVSQFAAESVAGFLDGYARDLMLGQPTHIEIVGEKMTVESTLRPVAMHYTIPYTIGRGYSSLPPRKAMCDRFTESGKDKLVLLFLSDHDPEGENIPESFGRSMRDDFGVKHVHTIKVGLNADQVRKLKLPPNTEAKAKGSRFDKFAAKHGKYAYELEAVAPDMLRTWLRDAINSVIDVDMFNQQVEQEKADSVTLAAYKRTAIEYLRTMGVSA